MPLRVTTRFTGAPVTGGGINQLFFTGAGLADAQAAVDAVEQFWTSASLVMSNQITISIDPEVVDIAVGTGEPIAVNQTTGVPGFLGSDSGAPLPRATQGLVRLGTSVFRGGRQVRGRINVPGPTEGSNDTDATPTSAYLDTLTDAASALGAGVDVPLVIYSRPNGPTPGAVAEVDSATVWDEWAVLRSRRD